MRFLILPNQLFDKKYLDKSLHYVIWECPHFFTAYNYNKKKLMLHRASMKYYYDYLKKHNYHVSYIEYNNILEQDESYLLYNPLNKPDILGLPKHYKIYDKPTPSLLLSPTLITEYRKKTKKFFFNAFYMWSKQKLNIIPKIKSQDKMNRSIIKNTPDIKQPFESHQKLNKYIEESIKYVQKHFPNNYGNTDNFIFPITHKDANNWLTHFIKYKSESFGTYQDFIHKDNPYLYHSLLSPLINIGLLTPLDVIKHLNSSIPLNSYEGFIRQLFWREYQYYCYIYYDYSNKNYFNNNKKLTTEWYTGNTGITPIDDAIKEGFNSGYLHHIRRLMVVGNYMNLCQIHPKEGFRWFMEFSCDSYEWVMYQNVYDMVFFVSGGATMRRPYISSSNYIIKMSNYKKDKWSEVWNNKYKQFIIRNKNKLIKFRYYIRLHI